MLGVGGVVVWGMANDAKREGDFRSQISEEAGLFALGDVLHFF